MLFPKSQIVMIVLGFKTCTLRKPDYRIRTDKVHKFVNNFKYGAFASAFIESAELINVEDIDDKLAMQLGYRNREEYLKQGWNDEYDERLLIRWSSVNVNWDVVCKIFGDGKDDV